MVWLTFFYFLPLISVFIHLYVAWVAFVSVWRTYSLTGTLNPLGHGTAQTRGQCSLTHTHNTWTVVCYIPENVCWVAAARVQFSFSNTGWTLVTHSLEGRQWQKYQKWIKGSLSRRRCAERSQLVSNTEIWTDSPLVASSSIGCLKSVMSLKVQRKSTTLSFSFLIGATCM